MAQVAYPNATTTWITYGNKVKGFLAVPESGSPPYPAVVLAHERYGLVQHTLGPLLAWEAAHPSDLVRTLEVHLRHGCSPTRTAALLHIGRQSLYQRLERIESLLGLEIDDPDLLGELLAAVCAHRVVRGRSAGGAAIGRRSAAA